jgi:hypothetical protein
MSQKLLPPRRGKVLIIGRSMKYLNFELHTETIEDDDVVKIIHYAYDNEELMIHTLDHSSYRYMTEEEFKTAIDKIIENKSLLISLSKL